MRLSRLEISGFKSFATRVSLEFGSGIMAIVGPNGCGKTNIIDAIRWVLGEQAPKSLRVESMRDLIFKGTKTRRPLGMAEISLLLVGDELPTQFRGNVKITRRITGDNESFYLINDIPARLKDVHNLLYDTGIGVGSYYHIDQGTIKRILDSNPDERRALFEEAAGVSKFKRDLYEASLKLSSSETKLETIELIIRERSDRVNALRREASKAQRFLAFKREINLLGSKIYSSKIARVKKNILSLEKRLSSLMEEKERMLAELANLELARNELIMNKNAMESALKDTALRLKETDTRKNRLAIELASLNEKVIAFERVIEQGEQVVAELKKGVIHFDDEKSKLEAKLAELRENIAKISNDISALSNASFKVDEELLRLKSDSRSDALALEKLNSELVRLEQEMLFKTQMLQSGVEDSANIASELESTAHQIKQYETELNRIEVDSRKIEKRLNRLAYVRAKFEKEFEKLNDEQNGLLSEHNRLEREVFEYNSRIESIERVLSGKVLLGSVAERILAEKDKWGIIGRFYELIDVDEPYVKVIEAVFGDILSYFVVRTRDEVFRIIEAIEPTDERIGFVVLEDIVRWAKDVPDGYVSADSVVSSSSLRDLLSNVLINAGSSELIIPEQGVYVIFADNKWIMTKGVVFNVAGGNSGLLKLELERKRYIRLLEEKRKAMSILDANIEENNKRLNDIRRRIEKVVEFERRFKDNLNGFVKECERVKVDLAHLCEKKKELEGRRMGFEERVGELERDVDLLRARYADLLKRRDELQGKLAERKKKEAELEAESGRLAREIVQLELTRARADENIRNIEREMERLKIDKDKTLSRIDEEIKRIEKAKEDYRRVKEEIAIKNQQLDDCVKMRQEIEIAYGELEQAIANLRLDIDGSEVAIKKKRAELEGVEGDIRVVELELAGLQERYHSLEREAELEGFSVVKGGEPELSEDDERALEEQFMKRKKGLEKLGVGVNLDAIEEYEEAKKHLDFLLNQRNDIVSGIEKLKKTIEYLECESRRRLISTIDLVRDGFRAHFTNLFGGGQADLVLTGDDPLNAGLEIIAHPPGKKMLPLAQLSTGENYLTAFALLFGLYSIKPAPFCLLDEVDAPLDEVNTTRFINLLREYSKNIQFIMVTHNRLVIENADYLFGVTMEEDGVSKVMSVRVEDVLV